MAKTKAKKAKSSNHGGARPGAGRKPYKFNLTDQYLVASMAIQGMPKSRIMELIARFRPDLEISKLSPEAFENHFAVVIENAKDFVGGQVTNALIRNAVLHEETQAQKFYLQSKEGWKPGETRTIENPDGEPFCITFNMGEPAALKKKREQENAE